MKNYTVIGYVTVMGQQEAFRVYDDTTERCFNEEHKDLADQYGAYLSAKYNTLQGFGVDIYEKEIDTPQTLDIEALRRADALAKLTPEERELLDLP